MEDKELREISEETLKELLEELNEDFVAKLPISAKEILKYATRRKNPQISDNIRSQSLRQAMLDNRLSDKDYLRTFFEIIVTTFGNKKPIDTDQGKAKPKAHILIAQTGAGKTKLRELILGEYKDTAIINPDEYKGLRPDATELRKKDPVNFGALTGIDGYDHARNIFDFAMDNNYNFLVEVAPSSTQGIVGVDLKALEDNGYDIDFHALSVGDLVSGVAIHKRYSEDLKNKKPGAKLTDANRHNESYSSLVPTIRNNVDTEKYHLKIYKRGKDKFSKPEEIDTENLLLEGIIKAFENEQEQSNMKYVVSGHL